MPFSSDDWQKFGQVQTLVAQGVPIARACRATELARWKFYRMLKANGKEASNGDSIP